MARKKGEIKVHPVEMVYGTFTLLVFLSVIVIILIGIFG